MITATDMEQAEIDWVSDCQKELAILNCGLLMITIFGDVAAG